jgi:hypothetical protein
MPQITVCIDKTNKYLNFTNIYGMVYQIDVEYKHSKYMIERHRYAAEYKENKETLKNIPSEYKFDEMKPSAVHVNIYKINKKQYKLIVTLKDYISIKKIFVVKNSVVTFTPIT